MYKLFILSGLTLTALAIGGESAIPVVETTQVQDVQVSNKQVYDCNEQDHQNKSCEHFQNSHMQRESHHNQNGESNAQNRHGGQHHKK